jgi:hypothetical protein
MQAISGVDDAELRPSGRPRLTNPHRVEFAFDIAAPEFEKAAQLREVRGNVELLPDEALQEAGMIRQTVDDLRGGQTIIAKFLLLVVVHPSALVLRARLARQACAIERSVTSKKMK